MQRRYSRLDALLIQADQALRTLVPGSRSASRPSPAQGSSGHASLPDTARRHAAGLMRINHTGEVCAQALYQGQALTARLPEVRTQMDEAAREEEDHLNWCEGRLKALDSRPSLLNPLWYGMSFSLGAAAGLAGDKWSLGFVAETERQVCEHLDSHLNALPSEDEGSRAVLAAMREDEARHAENAEAAGAAELPAPVRGAMGLMARVMKGVTYRV